MPTSTDCRPNSNSATESGLFYLVNYQFSKNLDNNSGEADANDTSYSTHFNFDHSYSNFDVRNRAVGSLGYELPFGNGRHFLQTGIGKVIAGGWPIQPIVQLRTGFPFRSLADLVPVPVVHTCRNG